MNFADITDITIPAGDVLKIQDVDAKILWQKPVTGIQSAIYIWYFSEKGLFVIPAYTKWGDIYRTCFISSTDGKNWEIYYMFTDRTPQYAPTQAYENYILHFPKSNKYILEAHREVAVSSDLLHWERYKGGTYPGGAASNINQAAYSKNLDKILKQPVVYSGDLYVVSNDGTHTKSQLVEVNSSDSCTNICCGESIFCATLENDGRKPGSAISLDGINWSKKSIENIPGVVDYFIWNELCYATELGKFFCVCSVREDLNNSGLVPYIAISIDGLVWTFYKTIGLESGLLSGGGYIKFIWVSSLRKFVLCSYYNIFISSDGINWINVFHGDDIIIYSLCWSETLKKCCAVVCDKDRTQSYSLLSSLNLMSWTKYPILPVLQD